MDGIEHRSNIHFNPRSPCGERQPALPSLHNRPEFQSTLSLRRATTLR